MNLLKNIYLFFSKYSKVFKCNVNCIAINFYYRASYKLIIGKKKYMGCELIKSP